MGGGENISGSDEAFLGGRRVISKVATPFLEVIYSAPASCWAEGWAEYSGSVSGRSKGEGGQSESRSSSVLGGYLSRLSLELPILLLEAYKPKIMTKIHRKYNLIEKKTGNTDS